ncbi:MAG: FAD-dependent oxidoreductase [Chloroflexota bacterium]|nr:FAD-dependent oxidoreductase [Chloroflexota bacterium]
MAGHSYDAHCCIVGGGPAGMVLALLLARAGVPVALLEEHVDFERDFRGDTIHPSTMELMDELGLADRLLQLPHTKLDTLTFQAPSGPVRLADLRELGTKFPYITFMPQARFLDFLAAEGRRYPTFRLHMGANVQGLIEEPAERGGGTIVRGVTYRTKDGFHELRAPLTVGADGRFSRVRRLAGFEPIKTAPPMDVLWFRLPRRPGDPEVALGRIAKGHLLAILNRGDEWQVAYVIAKGSYKEIREAGLPAFRRAVAEVIPEFADRVDALREWKQVSLLSVESSRVPRWYRPGLLLIGDAAHVMSPVGGVGINYAIQDAVVAANVLAKPLRTGRLRLRDLAAVQRRREWPTRAIQAIQAQVQKLVVETALRSDRPLEPPAFLRLPVIRAIPPRIVAFGLWPVHLAPELRDPAVQPSPVQ